MPRTELALAALTGVLFVVFGLVSSASKVVFAVPCIALWGAYGIYRRKEISWLGRPRDYTVPIALVVAIVAIAIAKRGIANPPRETWLLLLLYPPWGLVQQMIVQVFVARNLRTLGLSAWLVVPFAAIVFGAVHAPDWTLVAITTGAGLVFTGWYLRHPALVPLALAHGWSGAFVYTWILNRSALHP